MLITCITVILSVVPTAPSFIPRTLRPTPQGGERKEEEEEKRLYIYILHTWCYTSAGVLCAVLIYYIFLKRRRRRVPPRSNMAELRGTQPHSRLLSSPFCLCCCSRVFLPLRQFHLLYVTGPSEEEEKGSTTHTGGEREREKKETLYIRDLCVSWIFFSVVGRKNIIPPPFSVRVCSA